MFVLDQEPRFTHPVTVNKPVDGGFEQQTFKATFLVIMDSELGTYDLDSRAGSTDFLKKALVGFADVQGADDQDVLFSDQTRDAMIDMPFVRVALVKSYLAAVYKAQLGN